MPLKWRKVLIAEERYETAGVFDVNGDGVPDIVSGAWWYEGPLFTRRHFIGQVQAEGEYYDDFSTIPLDVNGNGRLDFVTGGWWGNTLRWRENPGDPDQEWPEHIIAECGSVETTRACDVDGDGHVELVPNTPGGPLVVYKLLTDARGCGPASSPPTASGTERRDTAWAAATWPGTAARTSCWPTAGWRPPRTPGTASGSSTQSSTWAQAACPSW